MIWKFRGYDAVGNKGWVYGDLVHNKRVDLTDRVMVGGYEVVPESVGLWTGLKDKNGKDVYEGDIISNAWCFEKKSVVKFGKYQHLNAQREYNNGDLGFYVYHLDEFKRKVERNDIQFFFCNEDKGEVVGNVYQNKELLKNEQGNTF